MTKTEFSRSFFAYLISRETNYYLSLSKDLPVLKSIPILQGSISTLEVIFHYLKCFLLILR